MHLCPRHAVAGCLLLGALAGCGPSSESERAYFAAREAERLEREDMHRAITTPLPDDEVLALVRDHAAPDGSGTMMAWIKRETSSLQGQVLFPRWQVTRRGSSKYEVRYTFTWINSANRISNRGFVWTVDGELNLVSDPHELEPVEPAVRARSVTEQQRQRVREEEYSLE